MFDRREMGGAINAIGIQHQDCAAIAATFDVLDDPNFVKLTVEHHNDCELVFRDHIESIQVKANTVELETMRKYVRRASENGTKDEVTKYVILADSYENSAHQFIIDFNTYKANPDDLESYRADVCKRLQINEHDDAAFQKAMKFEFQQFQQVNNANLAAAQIMEWAHRSRQDCDYVAVMKSLKPELEEQRTLRGSITKSQLLNIIEDNRIVPSYSIRQVESEMLGYQGDLIQYVTAFIDDSINQPSLSQLTTLKLLIESGSPDAGTSARDLATFNPRYRWLEIGTRLMVHNYSNIKIELPKANTDFEKLSTGLCELSVGHNNIAINLFELLVSSSSISTNVNYLLGKLYFDSQEYERARTAFHDAIGRATNAKFKSHIYCWLFKCEQAEHPYTRDVDRLDIAIRLDRENAEARELKLRQFDELGWFPEVLDVYDSLNLFEFSDKSLFDLMPLILIAELQVKNISRLRLDMISFLRLAARMYPSLNHGLGFVYVGMNVSHIFQIEIDEAGIMSMTLGETTVHIDSKVHWKSAVGITVPIRESKLNVAFSSEWQTIEAIEGRLPTRNEVQHIYKSSAFKNRYGYPWLLILVHQEELDYIKNLPEVLVNHTYPGGSVTQFELLSKPGLVIDAELKMYLYKDRASVFVRLGLFRYTIEVSELGEGTWKFVKKFNQASDQEVYVQIGVPGGTEELLIYLPRSVCEVRQV